MKRRLQAIYWRGILIALAMAIAAIGVMVKLKIDDTRANLSALLHAASLWTLESNADLQQLADSIASVSPSTRVTFLMDTGLILADSRAGADRAANHYDDPEIVTARQGEVGRHLRLSGTDATYVLYMARRVAPQLILRVSYPVLEIAKIVTVYGVALLVLFFVLYQLQRRGIPRFARDQVRQMEDVRRLLDGEVDQVSAVFPEFQPALNAIAYRVERLRVDQEEIKRTLQLRSDFVANASHELRSPLTSVRGFAEMLEDGLADTPEERALCVSTIRDECDRMLAVIEDILRLSKAERPAGQAEAIDALPVAGEVCRALTPQAAAKRMALRAEGRAKLPVPEKDLWEIVYNLVDNAIRYGREGGHVDVILAPGRIDVKDDGIGIAPEHQGHIFEQFYRVDDTRGAAPGGTGLGLSIVRALVERSGGAIRVESVPGVGSRFILTWEGGDQS
ncbi:MAG: hypothetical protein IJ662_02590 [Clostridia bacterium]|nr:hypothetical protein [Clostridia bacterium]